MGRPHLPLSSVERSQRRAALVLGVIVSALGLGVAALALAVGRYGQAALVVTLTIVYALAVWSIRLRTLWLTTLLIAVGFVVLGVLDGRPFLGLALAAVTVGWLAWRAHARFDSQTIKPVPSDATDPLSTANVAAFESLGFDRVGALSFEPGRGRTIVGTVLIRRGGDCYAVATDLVLEVASVFGERRLATRNSGVVTPPPDVLANDLRGADPTELVEAHDATLTVLRTRGLTPDCLRHESLLELVATAERRDIEWTNSHSWRQAFETFTGSGKGAGILDESPRSQQRIDAWLGEAVPTS